MDPLFNRAVIIDDETDGRNIVSFLLKQFFPEITLIGQAGNVTEGAVLIQSSKPDLVFLDVEMPDGNAFDLLSACPAWQGQVILITAHDHYAIKAIKASVLDYLLKPVDEEEFVNAVNKAIKRRRQGEDVNPALLLDVYKHLMIRKVRIPTLNGFTLISIDDIIYCEASGNYTVFCLTNDRKIVVSRKLGEYEEELKVYGFIRVHSKHLINSSHIVEYHKGKSGGGYVILIGRIMIEVSARRKTDLLSLLG
jgi:two-component system LytT family response regulator